MPSIPDSADLSRAASHALRHDTAACGLRLDAEGWASLDEVIAGCAGRSRSSRQARGEPLSQRRRVRNGQSQPLSPLSSQRSATHLCRMMARIDTVMKEVQCKPGGERLCRRASGRALRGAS